MQPLKYKVKTNAFKYWGGKVKITNWVLSHFPTNYDRLSYVEPFCGSAILLLNKDPSKVEIISDVDKNLFCLYKAIKEAPDELMKRLDNTLYSVHELNHALEIIDTKYEGDDEWMLRAWAKYVSLRFSFMGNNGMGVLMGGSSLKSHTSGMGGKHVTAFRNSYLKIPEVTKRLKYVKVFCKDAIKMLDNFDDECVFFYLDPPYPNTNQSGYTNDDYTMDDFNKLTEKLKTIKGKYLISFEMKEGMECRTNLGDRHLFTKKIIRNSKVGFNGSAEGAEAVECLMCNYKVECVKQLAFDMSGV